MNPAKLLLTLLLLGGSTMGQASVIVSGDVRHSGVVNLHPGARLLDAIVAAQPNAQSYWIAAAWLRPSLLDQQLRLKAGVLFDLKVLERGALLLEMPSRAALAQRLFEQVRRLPVTGRRVAQLDPVALEVGFARNERLDDGDQLVYPNRPSTVEVLGAVAQSCHLPYHPRQEPIDYVKACTSLADAERDYVWLIQPNGLVRRMGVAMWNLEQGHWPIAGSKILVPVKNVDVDPATPDLNHELAELLATQPVAEEAP